MAVQNEARRGQRRRAPDAPVPPEIACQVIPIGDEAPCPRRGTGENPRVCEDHRLDHQRLYFAYKHASAKAKQLCAQLAVDPDLRRGASLSEERLRRAIERREEYERAIDAELGGREMHRQRFNLDVDDGHAQWLVNLQAKRDTNLAALNELRGQEWVFTTTRAREDEERARHAAEMAAEEERRDAARREHAEAARKREEERAMATRISRAAEELAARESPRRLAQARQQEVAAEARRAHETQPLRQGDSGPLQNAIPSYGQPTPRGVSASGISADLEQQDVVYDSSQLRESGCASLTDFVVVLMVGVCAFFLFVKLIG